MASHKFNTLARAVLDGSQASDWTEAVHEWVVVDLDEDPAATSSCVCGHPELRYLFTIRNEHTQSVLFPIGSSCINHFEREDLDRQINVLGDLLRLRKVIQAGDHIELTSKLFTRAMLEDLYEHSAFTPDQYNGGDGERDVDFLLKMFNKRDKTAITRKQHYKIQALLQTKVIPFVSNDPRLK